MKNRTIFIIYLSIAPVILIMFISCIDLPHSPIPMQTRDGTNGWIKIKTGLTDSSNSQSWLHSLEADELLAYAARLDDGGFEITWSTMEEADYYEIRVSKQCITDENWNKAALAATVSDNKSLKIKTTIKKLQPKINGSKCTGCEYCVAACPNMAITIFRNKAVIDLSLCTGCGKCYDTCNYNAVSDIFLGELYYFAVRAFSSNGAPSQKILCTNFSYMLRYVNIENLLFDTLMVGDVIIDITPRASCGKCRFEGCFINKPENGGKGCPVNAIYADSTGLIHIDQSKCIYCGYCLKQCITGLGNASVRREVISSEESMNF